MKLQIIRASDLARNTSAILERILLGETVSVMRNRTEIAHIVPCEADHDRCASCRRYRREVNSCSRRELAQETAAAISRKRSQSMGMIFDTSIWVGLAAGRSPAKP